MLCRNCGTELQENTKFCPNCGRPVSEAGSAAIPLRAEEAEVIEADDNGGNTYHLLAGNGKGYFFPILFCAAVLSIVFVMLPVCGIIVSLANGRGVPYEPDFFVFFTIYHALYFLPWLYLYFLPIRKTGLGLIDIFKNMIIYWFKTFFIYLYDTSIVLLCFTGIVLFLLVNGIIELKTFPHLVVEKDENGTERLIEMSYEDWKEIELSGMVY